MAGKKISVEPHFVRKPNSSLKYFVMCNVFTYESSMKLLILCYVVTYIIYQFGDVLLSDLGQTGHLEVQLLTCSTEPLETTVSELKKQHYYLTPALLAPQWIRQSKPHQRQTGKTVHVLTKHNTHQNAHGLLPS